MLIVLYKPQEYMFYLYKRSKKAITSKVFSLQPRPAKMAEINVEVTSKEIIKPASPTPQHLKILNLSFLDQIVPAIYVPLIFFYQVDQQTFPSPSAIDEHLRQSLSKILTHFYPLAGTVEGDRTIKCNDEGAQFISAKVSNTLEEIVENPRLEELKSLLPFQPFGCSKNVALAVQVNHFVGRGGVAIGVCISHKIADGLSAIKFMNAWAAMARGGGETIISPIFDSVQHFPPVELKIPEVISISKEKIVTKRFVLDGKRLNELKHKSMAVEGSVGFVKDPTRVEVVSAFIWKHMIGSAKVNCESKQTTFAASHAVNLRTRMEPPLPEQTFGNASFATIGSTSTTSMTPDNEIKYQDLVGPLRRAIKKINNDFIAKKIQTDECLIEFKKLHDQVANGGTGFCNFTSWYRFPMYEVDFGWGTPIWVCTSTFPYKNVIILLSTKSGDGIEVWANMAEEDVAMFDHHLELL